MVILRYLICIYSLISLWWFNTIRNRISHWVFIHNLTVTDYFSLGRCVCIVHIIEWGWIVAILWGSTWHRLGTSGCCILECKLLLHNESGRIIQIIWWLWVPLVWSISFMILYIESGLCEITLITNHLIMLNGLEVVLITCPNDKWRLLKTHHGHRVIVFGNIFVILLARIMISTIIQLFFPFLHLLFEIGWLGTTPSFTLWLILLVQRQYTLQFILCFEWWLDLSPVYLLNLVVIGKTFVMQHWEEKWQILIA